MSHHAAADAPGLEQGLSARQAFHRKRHGLSCRESSAPVLRPLLLSSYNAVCILLSAVLFAMGSLWGALPFSLLLLHLLLEGIPALHAAHHGNRPAQKRVWALRSGKPKRLSLKKLVAGDLLLLSPGARIPADCVLRAGGCTLDLSQAEGLSRPSPRETGDVLPRGSRVASGGGTAQVLRPAPLPGPPPRPKDPLRRLMNGAALLALPLGGLIFWGQLRFWSWQDALIRTALLLTGLLPLGILLLASCCRTASRIRLSRKKVRVRDFTALEALAQADTLCLDKTGVLTNGLEAEEPILLPYVSGEAVEGALRALSNAFPGEDEIFTALARRFSGPDPWTPSSTASQPGWIGGVFEGRGSYLLGSPELLLPDMDGSLRRQVDALSQEGTALLLAHSLEPVDGELPSGLVPRALLLIRERLRPRVKETLRLLREEGMDLRLLSGDTALNVTQAARRAELPGWEDSPDPDPLSRRVCSMMPPEGKAERIAALREQGRIVAMAGDGYNDSAALREADCAICMAQGRASGDGQILVHSMEALPQLLAEGRRTAGYRRAAALLLAQGLGYLLPVLLFPRFPFLPEQLALLSSAAVLPALILAFAPCGEPLKGRFLRTVLSEALPEGVLLATAILLGGNLSILLGFSPQETAAVCLPPAMASVLLAVCSQCRPWTPPRKLLAGSVCGLALACCLLFPDALALTAYTLPSLLSALSLTALSALLHGVCAFLKGKTSRALPSSFRQGG